VALLLTGQNGEQTPDAQIPEMHCVPRVQASPLYRRHLSVMQAVFTGQIFPHTPQLLLLSIRYVSQPLLNEGASQSPHPGWQVGLHSALMHCRVAVWLPEQTCVQSPQLLGLVESPHTPPQQIAFGPVGQQLPVSTTIPGQQVPPPPHGALPLPMAPQGLHCPARQTFPVGQSAALRHCTHCPFEQMLPTAHCAFAPQRQLPPAEQLSARVGLQAVQAPPPVPHVPSVRGLH